ncbi:hypothetical protein WIW51_12410, partial [Paenibacillus sp. PL2-23]
LIFDFRDAFSFKYLGFYKLCITDSGGKLYSLISPNYRFVLEEFASKKDSEGKPSLYDRLLLATDFICGMTDSYAFELYQKLTGVRL